MFCGQDGSMIDVFRCADIGSPPRALRGPSERRSWSGLLCFRIDWSVDQPTNEWQKLEPKLRRSRLLWGCRSPIGRSQNCPVNKDRGKRRDALFFIAREVDRFYLPSMLQCLRRDSVVGWRPENAETCDSRYKAHATSTAPLFHPRLLTSCR